ncbi:hypothetical protein OG943_30015 [Amycolatopsis sp. NBC_00345]|uniref:hypothetical protein n=1 Tax=Amycolatopsis sp. NBC_00345 TaxID=2975955 RepID=UPI002E252683
MRGKSMVAGSCLVTLALLSGCGSGSTPAADAPSTPPVSSVAPPQVSSVSAPPVSAAEASPDPRGWALLMCLTTTSISTAPLVFAGSPHDDPSGFASRVQSSAQLVRSAVTSVDSIPHTGLADVDDIATRLRQSVDSAAPKITALFDQGAAGSDADVTARLDQANALLAGIHPDGGELYDAAQSSETIGAAYRSATSCPVQRP